MPKSGIEDDASESVTSFVLRWNNWSTSQQRQQLYAAAWKADHRSALGFITALAAAMDDQVPEHIGHYLTRHENFSRTFLKAFKKVKKKNWRFGAVVNQFDFSFPPAVSVAENKAAKIVMLYVVGDPAA
ncbi:hypothetical protein [Micropruina sp.]|uniref:hypothetical protein n=1 Tax=Micropruina sp. TaxID=2737536 RepID=UPI0039E3539A